jgi:hypothetical protein
MHRVSATKCQINPEMLACRRQHAAIEIEEPSARSGGTSRIMLHHLSVHVKGAGRSASRPILAFRGSTGADATTAKFILVTLRRQGRTSISQNCGM